MTDLRAIAISGSPRAPSKSRTVAELVLRELGRNGCATSMIDCATLPAEALVARAQAAEMDAAIAALGEARIVVAASPTYRALYTGVMKAFFDLLPQAYLSGKVCVPVLTAAAPQHFLAIEHGFRPLFASLEGTGADGIYATDDQFADGKPSDALLARIERVAAAALALARAMAD